MGRPRGFDEQDVVRAAVTMFAGRGYDSLSVDDLVAHLGVHRNSLYKTFGSKRGLYLTALRAHVEHDVTPLIARIAAEDDPSAARAIAAHAIRTGGGCDLLLLAAVERAPVDAEVAALVAAGLAELDRVLDRAAATTVLGLWLRTRAGLPITADEETETWSR